MTSFLSSDNSPSLFLTSHIKIATMITNSKIREESKIKQEAKERKCMSKEKRRKVGKNKRKLYY